MEMKWCCPVVGCGFDARLTDEEVRAGTFESLPREHMAGHQLSPLPQSSVVLEEVGNILRSTRPDN